MLSFALSSVYYHCNFLYRHNYSLLYLIKLPVLDYRMYSIVEFLGEKTVDIVASNWIIKEGDVSTC